MALVVKNLPASAGDKRCRFELGQEGPLKEDMKEIFVFQFFIK